MPPSNEACLPLIQFREPGAARAGGYVLALASLLVVIGLIFHPVPAGGFEERRSVLSQTPWWGLWGSPASL